MKFKSVADKVFYRYERDQLLRKQGGLCAYCKKPVSPQDVTMDHVVPLSAIGGRVHSVENCVAACLSCNRRKGSSVMPEPPVYPGHIDPDLPDSVRKAIAGMLFRLDERTRLAEFRLSMDPKGGYRKWVRYWVKRGRWS